MQVGAVEMHGSPSDPVAVQYLLPCPRGQLIGPQSPVGHVTSHAHALGQLTRPHEPLAVQSIVHRPLQVTSMHAPTAVQLMLQVDPVLHVMSPHAPIEPHVIWQVIPEGH